MTNGQPSDSPLVSVLIPTYCRPRVLRDALDSVTSQDYRPLEIIVGDDSPDEATARRIAEIATPDNVTLTFLKNDPPLGQAMNLNRLIDAAQGTYGLILHDDDLLLPGAIAVLVNAFREHPMLVACFGRQRLCSDAGDDLGDDAANTLNSTYHRTFDDVGVLSDPIAAAIRRQFPNDGFMASLELMKLVKYRPETEIGHAVDTDFGIRLAVAAEGSPFRLIENQTSVYRLSKAGVAASGSGATASFWNILDGLDHLQSHGDLINAVRRQIAAGAASHFARNGERKKAYSIWKSGHYGPERFRARGLYCAALIAIPHLAKVRDLMSP